MFHPLLLDCFVANPEDSKETAVINLSRSLDYTKRKVDLSQVKRKVVKHIEHVTAVARRTVFCNDVMKIEEQVEWDRGGYFYVFGVSRQRPVPETTSLSLVVVIWRIPGQKI